MSEDKFKIKSIKKLNKYLIESVWNDNFTSIIKISALRKNCPCALCDKDREQKSAEVGMALPMVKFGEFEIKEIAQAGNYALKISWGDSHDSGIYNWELLRKLFEDNQLPEAEVSRLIEAGK